MCKMSCSRSRVLIWLFSQVMAVNPVLIMPTRLLAT
ncbi:hypothetical protein BIW11_03522 [Tropilaelaps mercedesae]|uniref:Uncharacterized protein n=1 Tax=Tropilaelaps mercedesae TaxID=418985 RepID=A0A1V9XK46_9ACAR|nr:hypothetical protein BIW11_03522 [Tropilaelaps mercedesae]